MKRALLVGVDTYQAFSSLSGCVNDVHALEPLLAAHQNKTPNFACHSLADPHRGVTRDEFRDGVDRLFAPGADVALLYVAGHGVHRGNDLVLATSDGTNRNPGITMTEILGTIADPAIREVIVILDCCFSGAAGRVPHLAADVAALRPGLAILTASRADQPATETSEDRGLFSTMLCGALEGGAADVMGGVHIGGLYAYLSECFDPWDQRPTLKANLDRSHELRRCHPAVPVDELRRLPALFPTADYELPLDPSYEPDADPADPVHEEQFAVLQRARSAKLVEPVGTPHLYFAAMESRSCRLTPLGRHYRLMAERRLL